MTEIQREIKRKKRVIEYAEKNGNIKTACRRFGIARSTFISGGIGTVNPAKCLTMKKKQMVTRARFERATPSFGGCSGNPATYRCCFAIRKTWFGPVVP